jgi:hypothetical protein
MTPAAAVVLALLNRRLLYYIIKVLLQGQGRTRHTHVSDFIGMPWWGVCCQGLTQG